MEDLPVSQRYVAVKSIADRFGVSKSTIYRLINSGGLQAVRVGRSFRVPVEAVTKLGQDMKEG